MSIPEQMEIELDTESESGVMESVPCKYPLLQRIALQFEATQRKLLTEDVYFKRFDVRWDFDAYRLIFSDEQLNQDPVARLLCYTMDELVGSLFDDDSLTAKEVMDTLWCEESVFEIDPIERYLNQVAGGDGSEIRDAILKELEGWVIDNDERELDRMRDVHTFVKSKQPTHNVVYPSLEGCTLEEIAKKVNFEPDEPPMMRLHIEGGERFASFTVLFTEELLSIDPVAKLVFSLITTLKDEDDDDRWEGVYDYIRTDYIEQIRVAMGIDKLFVKLHVKSLCFRWLEGHAERNGDDFAEAWFDFALTEEWLTDRRAREKVRFMNRARDLQAQYPVVA